MNRILTINTEYLRPSRTIETVIVKNEDSKRVLFIYNYEGNSFRVFKNYLGLINFFLNKSESDFHLSSEEELDQFLSTVEV